MSIGEIAILVLGGVAGIGGAVLVGWLRGRRSGGGASAGAVGRAEAAHDQVEADLATTTAAIDDDRATDHAAADDRWKVGGS